MDKARSWKDGSPCSSAAAYTPTSASGFVYSSSNFTPDAISSRFLMVVPRYPLLSCSQGRYFTTGSSTLLILPSAIAAPISTEVNDLDTELERNRDSRSAP